MLCNKHLELGTRKKKLLLLKMAIFFNFGANLLKRVLPYGDKNIFSQTFNPKGSFGIEDFKKITFCYPTPKPNSGIQCVKVVVVTLFSVRVNISVNYLYPELSYIL